MREQEQRQPELLCGEGDGEALAQGGSGILGAIVEGTTDAVFAKDLEGRYMMINSAAAQILGRPKGEIVGKDDGQLLPPETARRLAEADSRVMATGESSVYEEVLPVAGQSRTYLSTKGVFRDAGGNVAGIIGISRDITDRKRAEEALRRSEERFRNLAEGIDFIPWEADLATWLFTYVGPQAVKILGYPLEDWYRDGFWVDHIHPEDRVWVADYCATNSATCRHYRFEYRMLASDGRTVWLDDIVSVTEDEDGTKLLQGVMVDVSERKRAEEEVSNSRGQLEAILGGVADGVTAQDPDGRVVYANEAAARIIGYPSVQALLEAPLQEVPDRFHIMDEDGRPFPLEQLPGRLALQGERAPEALLRFRDVATGQERWSIAQARPVFDGQGRVRLAVNIFRDVTELRLMEEELRRSEERFRSLVQNASDVIMVVDAEGTIRYVSPAVKRVLGYEPEEMVGESALSFGHPDDREEAMRSLAELSARPGIQPTFESRVPHKDGSWRYLEHTANNLLDDPNVGGIVVNQHDITERKRAQAAEFEIRKAERRRISRDLHDGVLQDLALVTQRLEIKRLLDESDGPDDGLGPEIDSLRRAVRGLREAIYELRPYEAVPFIREVESMARHERELTPEREIGVFVEDGFPAELPEAEATQLQRLIREALTNARRHSAARHIQVLLGATEDELWAEVSDDGRGIEPGRSGGGLGLSTMKERATLLGGNLEIRSEPGTGTRVRLRMPHPVSPRS